MPIDAILQRISNGELVSSIAKERGVSQPAITQMLQRNCPEAYTAALIAGMKVQLAHHLNSGHTRRYRSLLAVAAQRYPDVFEFPYRTHSTSDSKMPAIQDVSHLVTDTVGK